jgi:hypothetical protein
MSESTKQMYRSPAHLNIPYPRWQIITRWIVATVVGALMAWIGVYWFTIRSYVTDYGNLEKAADVMYTGMNPITLVVQVGLYLLVTLGLSVGFAQWFTLQRVLPLDWSLTSMLGWGAFILVFFIPSAFLFADETCSTILGIVIGGSVLGAIQWLNLRRLAQTSFRMTTWVVTNVVGLFCGALVGWLCSALLQTFGPTHFFDAGYLRFSVLILASCLLVYAGITGVALSKVLATPQPVDNASKERPLLEPEKS